MSNKFQAKMLDVIAKPAKFQAIRFVRDSSEEHFLVLSIATVKEDPGIQGTSVHSSVLKR